MSSLTSLHLWLYFPGIVARQPQHRIFALDIFEPLVDYCIYWKSWIKLMAHVFILLLIWNPPIQSKACFSLPQPHVRPRRLGLFLSFLNMMLLFPRRRTLVNFHLSYCLLLTYCWLGCCSLLNCTQCRAPQRKDHSTSQSLMRCL